jgi:hypothetical protein
VELDARPDERQPQGHGFVTLLILSVPFPLLWGLWVALVDFLPMIGGALAGIPAVLFAATRPPPTARSGHRSHRPEQTTHRPGYAVESAPPGVARRGTGRPYRWRNSR